MTRLVTQIRADPPGVLAWTGVALLGALTSAAVTAYPVAGLGIVGLLAFAFVAIYPFTAILAVLALDGLALVFIHAGVDAGPLSVAVFAIVLVGASSATARTRGPVRTKALSILAGGAFLIMFGLIGGRGTVPIEQTFAGLRLIAIPTLCTVIGLSLSLKDGSRILRFGTLLMVASALAALIENQQGVQGLVGAGFEYGTTVRSYSGELRAPGLFAANYSLGAFAGVFGALAFVWWPSFEQTHRAKVWRFVALFASVACLVLSIYRTGIFILLLTILLWAHVGRGSATAGRKAFVLLAALAFVVFFVQSGWASAKSMTERRTLWANVLSAYELRPTGNGLGFSGSASNSRFALESITVDNYFLNLFLQFGIAALVVLVPLIFVSFWMLKKSSEIPVLRSGIVLTSCLFAFFFVNLWEYTSAMSLVMFASGLAYSAYRHKTESVREMEVHQVPVSPSPP